MHVLIFGASVRAAAYSALRAGLQPIGLDLFADRDLSAAGPAHRVDRSAYPDGLALLARRCPPGPWLYTGAIENHPDLVDRVGTVRPLWGNSGSTLRAVRDPFAVSDALQRAGLPAPAVRRGPQGLPRDGSWLIKPFASAGGRGIRPLVSPSPPLVERRDEGPGISTPTPLPHGDGRIYLQRRIDGPSFAALFVGDRTGASFVGVTRQWLGGRGFTYQGSLGPWPVAEGLAGRLRAVGRVLVVVFGLRGLFGVDYVLHDGHPWPVEVNPRYTASVEVLELALGRPLLLDHARACDPSRSWPDTSWTPRRHPPRAIGKLIVFATRSGQFPTLAGWRARPDLPFAVPALADVPEPTTWFATGEPVITLLTKRASVARCQRALERRGSRWRRRLSRSHAEPRGSGYDDPLRGLSPSR